MDGISRTTWVLAGLALRLTLLGWGTYQDVSSAVPYTDIDYHVFTAAARHLVTSCPLDEVIAASPQEEYTDLVDPPEARGACAQGFLPAICRFVLQTEAELRNVETSSMASTQADFEKMESKLVLHSFAILRPIFKIFAGMGNPYNRDTYRYTPLLALLLSPGQLVGGTWGAALFGKLVFVLADVIVALLIWDIMDVRRRKTAPGSSTTNDTWLAGLFWLANPFTAQISTRGSSESVLGVLVLGFLDATLHSYPEAVLTTKARDSTEPNSEPDSDSSRWSNTALMAPFFFAFAIHWKLYPIIYAAALVPHLVQSESLRGVVRYGGIAIYSLIGISGPVYAIWGDVFLDSTLFYHLSRADHRHNFSASFLPAYLASSPHAAAILDSWPGVFSHLHALQPYLAFVPQLGLTAYLGFALGSRDLVAAMTFQTVAFVAINKVCTSQYYMWVLWFLPIIAPSLHFPGGSREVLTLVAVWVAAQVSAPVGPAVDMH